MGVSSGWNLVSRAAPRPAGTTGDARDASAVVAELRPAREARRQAGASRPRPKRRGRPAA